MSPINLFPNIWITTRKTNLSEPDTTLSDMHLIKEGCTLSNYFLEDDFTNYIKENRLSTFYSKNK